MLDAQAHLIDEPVDEESPTKRPTRIITYAWGERYVRELLSLTVPALLAPGNLSAAQWKHLEARSAACRRARSCG